jgi:hypothetical protein
VAAAGVADVEVSRVVAVEHLHPRGELRHGRFDNQVVVIRHQAEDVDGPAVTPDADGKQGEEEEAVGVVVVDRTSVDAPRGDVEVAIRQRAAEDAGHRDDGSAPRPRRRRRGKFGTR